MKARRFYLVITAFMLLFACTKDEITVVAEDNLPAISGYPIVGTNQTAFFNNSTSISAPAAGSAFYGQNAHYVGNQPSYTDNGDGTVTDNVTGLMWQQTLDQNGDGIIDYDDKLAYNEILEISSEVTTGGYADWRVPTIKEQYSLIMFSGRDISGYEGTSTEELTPFIDSDIFDFAYGDLDAGERLIDVQCATTTVSIGNMEEMVFGVNFADGRIKGYGTYLFGQPKAFNYLLVRGRTTYGINEFKDNGNGTITDAATGLMWMQDDSEVGMNWEDAIYLAENFEHAGKSDWRLPDAKELQSIIDYSRSPQTTNSAAIDPLFYSTEITNEAGEPDYPFFWSSTTHETWVDGHEGGWGIYVSFGRALGNMSEPMGSPRGEGIGMPPLDDGQAPEGEVDANWVDVHGAGAQRSDPKAGDADGYSEGHGPQGDAVRIYNYVRLVRDI